jgi:hypothetical protein
MAKKARPTRSVTFRMPDDHYRTLAAVAFARGTDVSALLNSIVTEAIPALKDWLAERRAASAVGEFAMKVLAQVVPEGQVPIVRDIVSRASGAEGREAQDEVAERLIRKEAPEGEERALLRTWVMTARALARVAGESVQDLEGGDDDGGRQVEEEAQEPQEEGPR